MKKWFEDLWENKENSPKFWLSLIFKDLLSLVFFVFGFLLWVLWLVIKILGAIQEKKSVVTVIGEKEIYFWLLVAFLVPTFVGLISHFSKYNKILEKFYDASSTIMLLENFINILKSFIGTNAKKMGVIKNFMDKLKDNFGGVVVGANEKEYINTLSGLIPSTQDTFCATLRGGNPPEYTIGWFFQDTPPGTPTPVITIREKKNYLDLVNNAVIAVKMRIAILREKGTETKDFEMQDFYNDIWRKKFFECNNTIDTYLINPDKLAKGLVEQTLLPHEIDITNLVETAFIWEDYAVFDGCIAVKHNGKNSLYLGVQEQVNKMRAPFALQKQFPRLFEKLTAEGIWSCNTSEQWELKKNWEVWKEENKQLLENVKKQLSESTSNANSASSS